MQKVTLNHFVWNVVMVNIPGKKLVLMKIQDPYPDVIKIPNIKLTMSPDICLNAIEPNKAADLIYSAEFKKI